MLVYQRVFTISHGKNMGTSPKVQLNLAPSQRRFQGTICGSKGPKQFPKKLLMPCARPTPKLLTFSSSTELLHTICMRPVVLAMPIHSKTTPNHVNIRKMWRMSPWISWSDKPWRVEKICSRPRKFRSDVSEEFTCRLWHVRPMQFSPWSAFAISS